LKIGTYRDQIEQAYRKALTSATESEVERMEEIIERILATNNKVALEIKAMLDTLQADNERIKAIAEKGSGDIRMRVLQHASLTRQFANAMKGIQDAQKDFKEKHKQALIRNYLIVRPFATQSEIDSLTNSAGGLTLTSGQVFALATKKDIRQTLDEMKCRRSSVINIENSLKAIQQMFVDLETMIDEQGEMLNDIETNLNNAEDYIAEAVETLKESVQMQKRMHRRCSIF
jgi:t-SNARE complex subunit (syntaxin)